MIILWLMTHLPIDIAYQTKFRVAIFFFNLLNKNLYCKTVVLYIIIQMKVPLAYRMSELHPTIPYIIFVTEDVSPESIELLEQRNISVRPLHKINTPYLSIHKAIKYQVSRSDLIPWQYLTQRELRLPESVRTDRQFCELSIGMSLCPDRQFNPSQLESAGQFDPSQSAVLPDKNCRPTQIQAN